MTATDRHHLARLILEVRYRGHPILQANLQGRRYEASTARALMHAQRAASHPTVVLSGTVNGDLTVSGPVNGGTWFLGEIDGNLSLDGSIDGNLTLIATVHGCLAVRGKVTGTLDIQGVVDKHVSIDGEITDGVLISCHVGHDVLVDGHVAEGLWVTRDIGGSLRVGGTVDGELTALAPIGKSLVVGTTDSRGSVKGTLTVRSSVGGNVLIKGPSDVGGDLTVEESGEIGGALRLGGDLGGSLIMRGSIERGLVVEAGGSVDGDVLVVGAIEIGCGLLGRFGGSVTLTPSTDMRLLSVLTARFTEQVHIGDHVQIDECDFRQCADLDRLHLVGANLFAANSSSLSNPPHGVKEPIPDLEMASIYRQLRANLEKRSNRPAAAAFYRGEMNARLAEARKRDGGLSAERLTLEAYCAISRYGESVWRPAAAFVAMSLIGYAIFAVNGLDLDSAVEPSPGANWHETWMFSVRSMLSFLNPPAADLTSADIAGQILLRFTGPALVALGVIAVRDKVAR